ncbi:MAG: hypothetical protein N4A49_06685 [Marinifilaceae bacterium]|jgi:hypothetical protein|nr:hypothetical protein [Marinifilaceae bacterium]
MNIINLNEEQRKEIFEQELEKREKERYKLDRDRRTWKELASENTDLIGARLYELHYSMMRLKKETYEYLDDIVKMKLDLFGGENQKSHKLSGKNYRIQLGRNKIGGHDDTMYAGVIKCQRYIDSLIKDDLKPELVICLRALLKSDGNMSMDASRILELTRFANELDNNEFADGVRIIQNAYESYLTSYFVKLEYRDELGIWKACSLNFSSVPFPEDFKTDLFDFGDSSCS